jgi:hypothetical protein
MASFYQVYEKHEEDGTLYTKVVLCVGGSDEGDLLGELEKVTAIGLSLPSPTNVKRDNGWIWKDYEMDLGPRSFEKLRGAFRPAMSVPSARSGDLGVGYGQRRIGGVLYDLERGNCGTETPAMGHCGQPRYLGPANGCVPPHLVPRSRIPPPSCGGG